MEKKALFVATTAKGHLNVFHIPYIRMLKEKGYQVDAASNGDETVPYADHEYALSIERSPLKAGNLKAIRQLCRILKQEKYDLILCHTPMGGVVARLAAKITGVGKVIYMAHGFHFYQGAPKKNWLIYYPVEWICAHFTDVLITINQEDYALAKRKMKAKKVVYLPGIGIDLKKFENIAVDRTQKREEIGVPAGKRWILNIGELIPRKNQERLIRAVAEMEGVYLTIAGRGELQEYLTSLIEELGVADQVKLLGFRRDIPELCCACDVFAFPSIHEGLPVSVMEAMAAGLPCAVSRIRGNTDLIDEKGGVLFDPYSVEDCRNAIETLLQADTEEMGRWNRERVKEFELGSVMKLMEGIYEEAEYE